MRTLIKLSFCGVIFASLFSTLLMSTSWTLTISRVNNSHPIAQMIEVPINGWVHSILVRGEDRGNPLLIDVHGGPGMGNFHTAQALNLLEQHFLTVKYDQRGAGKSCHWFSEDLNNTLTVDQLVDDLVEVTKYLLITFGKEKAFLTGVSWGATLVVLTAHRNPELFYAVSVRGVLVSQEISNQQATNILLAKLKEAGEKKEYIRLQEVASPRLKDFAALKFQRSLMNKFGMIFTHCRTERCTQYSLVWDLVSQIIKAPEYNWQDMLSYYWCAKNSHSILFKELQDLRLAETVPTLEIPIIAGHGRHDYLCQVDMAKDYIVDILGGELEVLEDQAHIFDIKGGSAWQRQTVSFFRRQSVW